MVAPTRISGRHCHRIRPQQLASRACSAASMYQHYLQSPVYLRMQTLLRRRTKPMIPTSIALFVIHSRDQMRPSRATGGELQGDSRPAYWGLKCARPTPPRCVSYVRVSERFPHGQRDAQRYCIFTTRHVEECLKLQPLRDELGLDILFLETRLHEPAGLFSVSPATFTSHHGPQSPSSGSNTPNQISDCSPSTLKTTSSPSM